MAALSAMSAAADAEDKTEKSVVTPGWLLPARELYGVMLVMRGMSKEALAAFEATLAMSRTGSMRLQAPQKRLRLSATRPRQKAITGGSPRWAMEMLIEQSSSPRANSCRRIEPRTGQPTWLRQPASPPRLRKAQRMGYDAAGRKRQMAVLKDGTHSMLRLIIVLAIGWPPPRTA